MVVSYCLSSEHQPSHARPDPPRLSSRRGPNPHEAASSRHERDFGELVVCRRRLAATLPGLPVVSQFGLKYFHAGFFSARFYNVRLARSIFYSGEILMRSFYIDVVMLN